MKTIIYCFAALGLLAVQSANAKSFTAEQSAFVAKLAVVPDEDHSCLVNVQPLRRRATHWQGTVTRFHDQYVLPLIIKAFDEAHAATGERPQIDIRLAATCVAQLFPPADTLNLPLTKDPILAYVRGLYLFDTLGCNAYMDAARDLELSAEDKLDGDDIYRIRSAWYSVSVMTLKCTGDVKLAEEQLEHAARHGYDRLPPGPIPVAQDPTPEALAASALYAWGYRGS